MKFWKKWYFLMKNEILSINHKMILLWFRDQGRSLKGFIQSLNHMRIILWLIERISFFIKKYHFFSKFHPWNLRFWDLRRSIIWLNALQKMEILWLWRSLESNLHTFRIHWRYVTSSTGVGASNAHKIMTSRHVVAEKSPTGPKVISGWSDV